MAFAIALLFVSCEKSNLEKRVNSQEPGSFDKGTFVSLENVRELASRIQPRTKSESGDDFTIKAILSNNSDTLMYVVNFGEGLGWKILSADTRTPAVIAEGEKGSFSLEKGSVGLVEWMENAKEDMIQVRHSSDSDLTFSEKEISANKSFWGKEITSTRDGIHETKAKGEWLSQTNTYYTILEDVDHMVPHWDQGSPYNYFCPGHYDAGCPALSTSQVLWYLHYTIGAPDAESILSEWSGTPYSSSLFWDNMSYSYRSTSFPNEFIPEAILIRQVGIWEDLFYTPIGSGLSVSECANNMMECINNLGITCSSGVYDEDVVVNTLCDGMPIIVINKSRESNGHAFVIDGYRKMRKDVITHYWYVSHLNPLKPQPIYTHEPYDVIESSTEYYTIRINWGWWTQWDSENPLNDGWYSLTGDWVTGTLTWDSNHRDIIYGFSL